MSRRTTRISERDDISAGPTTDVVSAVANPPNWLVILFLAISILVVYGRSLDAPFVLDDRIAIVENPSIKSLWPLLGSDARPGPLNPPVDLPTSARPLVNLSFAVNYWLHGTSVVGYRLVNVLLHVANTLLLWAIIRRTLFMPKFRGRFDTAANWLAFLAALLWALHPLQTEAVIYVTQRTELMVAFFYLATLYCSLKYWAAADIPPLPPLRAKTERTSRPLPLGEGRGEGALSHARTNWLILATLFCFCGMASKEVMVSAPLIVLLYQRAFVTKCLSQGHRGLSQFCGFLGAKWDCPPLQEGSGIGTSSLPSALRRSWPLYAGLASSWLLLLALNINSPRSASAGFHLGLPVVSWWLTQCKVLFIYLKLAVWPSPLLLHYELPYLHTFSEARLFAVPVALLAAIAVVLLVRNRILGFLLAFVAAILAPTFVVPVLTEMAAERRMYLPLAALAALLVIGAYAICEAWLARRPNSIRSSENIKDLSQNRRGLSQFFRVREEKWDCPPLQNGLGIGSKSLRIVAIACGCLAVFYGLISSQRHNVYRNELQIWQQVVDNQPANYKALYNLGLELNRLGREPESLAALQKSVEVNPSFPDSRSALGFALINAHRIPEAIDMLNAALALEPNHAAALNNLGIAYMRAGDLPKAIEQLKHAIKIASDFANAHHNLGRALASSGQVDEAIKELQAAASLTPNDLDVLNDLAMLFAAGGQRPQAIELTQRILEHRPDYAAAHHGLAMMLYESGNVRGAIDHFQRYLELVPNDVGAMCNLASVIATQGDFQNAALLCEQAARLAPDLPEAHFGLGTSLVKLDRLPEAIEHFQQALKLRSNYFAAHVELVKALAAAGRPAQAIRIAEQGLSAARAANDEVHATQLEQWLRQNPPIESKNTPSPSGRGPG